MNTETNTETDTTVPPTSALLFASPAELFSATPRLREVTQHKPQDDETFAQFAARLQESSTPEELVTMTAFAVHPKMAIWWGYECLRMMADRLSDEDRELLKIVADWTSYPDAENRYRAMKIALWAPNRTPAVYLALAVGWSGGRFAPNEPAKMPPDRAPRAVSAAVLSCLAQSDLNQRAMYLARFADLAETLYRH